MQELERKYALPLSGQIPALVKTLKERGYDVKDEGERKMIYKEKKPTGSIGRHEIIVHTYDQNGRDLASFLGELDEVSLDD